MSIWRRLAARLGIGQRPVQPAPPLSAIRNDLPPGRFWEEVLGQLRATGKIAPRATEKIRSLKLPKPWPGVVPTGAMMAQDSIDQVGAVYNFGAQAVWDGYGFMGYALLSDLAQVPEFRRPSEILANEMTRKWIKLISVAGQDKTEKLKVLEAELQRLGVQEKFRRAFELDNFFGRAQIFIDINGAEAQLKLPLVPSANVAKGSLQALRVIEPIWTYPNNYDAIDPLAEAFYRPQTWFVLSKEIHTSRLLTFVSRPVPDMLKPAYLFGGASLTQMLEPYVRNWIRTRQSVSDITHNFSTPVLKTNLGELLGPGGAQQMVNRALVFNTGRDNQGLMILNNASSTPEDFVIVSAPLAGLDKLQAQAQEQQAGIAGIPLVKYFGITPSGLNASSDGEIRSFYDTIESIQEREGTPALRTLLTIMQMSIFGEVDPDIGFVWQPLWSLDEKALAEVRKINAETDGTYIDKAVLDPAEVRQTVAAEEGSRYASINVDDVPEQEADPEAEGDPMSDPSLDTPPAPDAPDAKLAA